MLVETAAGAVGKCDDQALIEERRERMWLVAIGLFVVIQLWFGMIGSSLWLDETGTWWIVKDSFAQATQRAQSWQGGMSPLYFWIAWLSVHVFGVTEWAIRLPSVLAMCGSIYFVHRLAERIYDRASAGIVALVFMCISSFYAIDARPYALAMLGITASTWALFRLLDSMRPVYAILYCAMALVTIYAHSIMALGLVPAAVYAIVVVGSERPVWLAWLGGCFAAIGAFSVPLILQLKVFYGTRGAHTFSVPLTMGQTVDGFFPGSLMGIVIAGCWLHLVFRGDANLKGKCSRASALLIGLWVLWGPLFLFLLMVFTDLRLFVPRYFSSSLPAQALLLGGLVSSIRPGMSRKVLLVALAVVAVISQGKTFANTHGNEDWRSALHYIRDAASESPVIFVAGFVEASSFASLRDPALKEVLFAPELMYGEPQRAIHVPITIVRGDLAELGNVADRLKSERQFFLVTENAARSHEIWLVGRLGTQCRSEDVPVPGAFGCLFLTRFVCSSGR